MRRVLGTAAAMLLLWGGLAAPAWAGEVVLANGDVLHGQVTYEGGRIVLHHPVLGTLSLADTEFSKFTLDGRKTQVPVPCTPPAAGSAPPCADAAKAAGITKPTYERPWDLAVGFGIADDRGNTVKFQINTDIEAEYRWRRINRLTARVNAFYEEAKHVQTEGKLFSKLVYRRRLSARDHAFAAWLVDRDDFADIQLRNGWFLGYSRDFIKTPRTTLSGDLGAGGVVENRTDIPMFSTGAFFARLAYEHKWSTGDSFRASYYVTPYLDHTELSPMRLELRYAHPLRDHIDLTAGFLLDYVPDPPGDIEPYDTKLTFGIRWKR